MTRTQSPPPLPQPRLRHTVLSALHGTQKVLRAHTYIYISRSPSLCLCPVCACATGRRHAAWAVATIVAIIATALKHLRPAPCNQKDFVALVPLVLPAECALCGFSGLKRERQKINRQRGAVDSASEGRC